MQLKALKQEFAICKVKDLSQVDLSDTYCFIGKTDEELSLVCDVTCIPKDCIECDKGWKGFRVQGILDFSLIGILSKISGILAEEKIGIFVVSTYNTDYVLVKEAAFSQAQTALEAKGYSFVE